MDGQEVVGRLNARAAVGKRLREAVAAADEPGIVADVVLQAAGAARPKLRYTAGRAAGRLRWLRRFAPAGVMDAGIRSNLRLEALERGDTNLAFSFADVAYNAYATRGSDRLRALALLQLAPLQFIAAPGSNVHGIADLRGRKAMFGTASGGASTAELVMKAYGLDPDQIRAEEKASDENAVDEFAGGKIAGMFTLGRYPLQLLTAMAKSGGRITPVTGPPVDRLLRDYPFFRPMMIPANTYAGQTEAVQTIGVHGVLLCRSDLDEELVYRLTKALFSAIADPASSPLLLHSVDVDLAAATPIPLHPGAARYYRERELFP